MINPKKIAGEKAAEFLKNGMNIGLGTGSTASYAIRKLGEMVAGGLEVTCFPTSLESELLARSLSIPLMADHEVNRLDVTIDGADEFDPAKNLIKGGGGALLREKIVAAVTDFYVVVADKSKQVDRLGAFTVPIEVVPFGWQITARHIQDLGGATTLRESDQGYFKTDNGNYILDSDFGLIENAPELEKLLNQIPGVVENGLFIGIADRVICVDQTGEVEIIS